MPDYPQDWRVRLEELERRVSKIDGRGGLVDCLYAAIENRTGTAPSLEATHTPEQEAEPARDVSECVHDALIVTTAGMRCTICKQEADAGAYDPAWHLPRCPVALMLKYAALRAPVGQQRLLEERYWCGCVRFARWDRCERHGDLEHDEEPRTQAEEERREQERTVEPYYWTPALTRLAGAEGPLGGAVCDIVNCSQLPTAVNLSAEKVVALARHFDQFGQQGGPERLLRDDRCPVDFLTVADGVRWQCMWRNGHDGAHRYAEAPQGGPERLAKEPFAWGVEYRRNGDVWRFDCAKAGRDDAEYIAGHYRNTVGWDARLLPLYRHPSPVSPEPEVTQMDDPYKQGQAALRSEARRKAIAGTPGSVTDLEQSAWILIANAMDAMADWDEWAGAAKRWRGEYHAKLGVSEVQPTSSKGEGE